MHNNLKTYTFVGFWIGFVPVVLSGDFLFFYVVNLFYIWFMENWKDIIGYEGIYQISDLGNIRSIKFGSKTLKKYINPYGRTYVTLYKKGCKKRNFKVHRLVAQAFIQYIENKPFINHIDGNATNNTLSNLEWCNHKENIFHSKNITGNGLVISKKKLLHLYDSNKNIPLEDFIKLVIFNMS